MTGEPSPGGEAGAAPRPGSPAIRRLLRALIALTVLLALLTAVRIWVFTPFRILSASMEPSLLGESPGHPGDTVLLNRLAYLSSGPRRWEVVAFRAVDSGKPVNVVKRVAGLPGETVELDGRGGFLIDGNSPERPAALAGIRYVRRGTYGLRPVTLGPRQYYLLGDNSYLSQDSRSFGPVAAGRISAAWSGSSSPGAVSAPCRSPAH